MSGNTFTLSVNGLTTQAQLGVKQGMISLLLLYGSYGYALTFQTLMSQRITIET